MAIGWSFPSNEYGMISGIGEAGIETFKGSPYRSLAREICQNSLDARIDDSKAVVVEFARTRISTSSIRDFDVLRTAILSCYNFWEKQNNKKTMDFFIKAVRLSGVESISLLRISDTNTTGLTGSRGEYGTPWQNLVKASGVSNKDGSSGGSFGIGKSAPYACSDLRTVYYATLDREGVCASQGIARLVSFPQPGGSSSLDADSMTTGIGYYGETFKNQPIFECLSLDPGYRRQQPGTDVYILGFSDRLDWQQEIIASVLEDFLISVYRGYLEVRVGSTTISRDTLGGVISRYQQIATTAFNYYQSLVSPEAYHSEAYLDPIGTVETHLAFKQGYHRQILMCRSNGMKVFAQRNLSGTIHFAGVCVLNDYNVNAFFREMENPQHNAWEPERHSDPAYARKGKQALYRLLKDMVLEYGKKTTADEVDAEGVGEYLPDDVDALAGDADPKEALLNPIKDIDIAVSDILNRQTGFQHMRSGSAESAEDAIGQPEGMDFGGAGGKDQADSEPNEGDGEGFGSNNGDGAGTHDDGSNLYPTGTDGSSERVRRRFLVKTMAVRLFAVNAQEHRYQLSFTPRRSAQLGCLQLKLSGEQSSVDVNVLSAVDMQSGQTLKCKGSTIVLSEITRQRTAIQFTVDYVENVSLEVSLLGYKD